VRTAVETFALADANEAPARLRAGRLRGAAVLLTPTHADEQAIDEAGHGEPALFPALSSECSVKEGDPCWF
jgi:hypothetical protein